MLSTHSGLVYLCPIEQVLSSTSLCPTYVGPAMQIVLILAKIMSMKILLYLDYKLLKALLVLTSGFVRGFGRAKDNYK